MKKFFCFHCQKEVKPFGLWKWRFCPHCKHFMTDDVEGFYKVCDNCGANLSPNAASCLKCGYVFDGGEFFNEPMLYVKRYPKWLLWLINIGILFLSAVIGLIALYLSFYVFTFLLLLGLIYFIFISFISPFSGR